MGPRPYKYANMYTLQVHIVDVFGMTGQAQYCFTQNHANVA